ncbi:MAG: transporter [Armatimonadota bacterium]
MHTTCLRVLLIMALCCLAAGSIAQTAPLPGTDTTTLPAETPPATTTDTGDDDDPATPPTSDAATLPAQAKSSSLMVKRGDTALEWRISYSHFSTSTLFVDGVAMLPVLVIGEVGVERMRKDLLINSLSLQYGLFDNFQTEVRVPFRAHFERRAIPDASPPQEETITGAGLGDIEGGLYYQFRRKSEMSTRWIASLQLKAATGRDIFEIDPNEEVPLGTGFWSTKVGLNGVKISDPAAVYWNFGYAYNWMRKNIRVVSTDPQTGDPVVSYVDIKPGNTFEFGGGIAYALNPKLSLNTGLTVSVNESTTANGNDLANTALVSASLRFGVVFVTGHKTPIDIGVSVGLTDDSPDFTLEMRRTFRF